MTQETNQSDKRPAVSVPNQDELIKELTVVEYQALREEILKRVGGQGVAFAATVALVGAFVGVLFEFKSSESQSLLVSVLSKNAEPEVIGTFAVLAGGFTLGVELLMTFWAYQLHMAFRLHHYIGEQTKRLRKQFMVPDDVPMFDWTASPRRIQELWDGCERHLEVGIRVASMLQPLMLLGLSLFGIILMACALPQTWESEFSWFSKLIITLAWVVLCLGWFTVLYVLGAHHERLGMPLLSWVRHPIRTVRKFWTSRRRAIKETAPTLGQQATQDEP